MPTLDPAVDTEDDLVLPIPGQDKVVRDYRIPPCTAGELFDLVALDAVWAAIGRHRLMRLVNAPASQVAQAVTQDPSVQARIRRLMEGELTAEDMLALPLGPVSEQMLADGVSKTHYVLASMTAMYWHLAGDDAAKQIWTTGKPPGKPAAPPRKNSTSTGGAAPKAARSKGTRSRRK